MVFPDRFCIHATGHGSESGHHASNVDGEMTYIQNDLDQSLGSVHLTITI